MKTLLIVILGSLRIPLSGSMINKDFGKNHSFVIQSYSNSYVKKSSGLSILFIKDLAGISSVRKKELFQKYSRSKFAKETGWDKLMMTYHDHVNHKDS